MFRALSMRYGFQTLDIGGRTRTTYDGKRLRIMFKVCEDGRQNAYGLRGMGRRELYKTKTAHGMGGG